MNRHITSAILAAGLAATSVAATQPRLSGTFVQLTRAVATNSVAQWRADIEAAKAVGVTNLVVQWSAEPPVAYVGTSTNDLPFCPESYATLERLFEAVKDSGVTVQLGLMNDSGYWRAITARDRVLRDYFLLRVARNERLQKLLLARFGSRPEWTGYYLSEEIDDLTWRNAARSAYMRDYLALMVRRLRANDPGRSVAVSAFFRGRTAPDIFARTLLALTTNATDRLDAVLVQDGVGVGDPPVTYVPGYFRTLRDLWTDDAPRLLAVAELFEQTSREGEPFAARPADPARVAEQLKAVAPCVDGIVAFTLKDYADPAGGAAGAALYRALAQPSPAPLPRQ